MGMHHLLQINEQWPGAWSAGGGVLLKMLVEDVHSCILATDPSSSAKDACRERSQLHLSYRPVIFG